MFVSFHEKSMRLEIIFTIVIVMIIPLSVYAQDLSPSQKITKDSKMDSVLTQIYNSNQQGAGIPSSVNPNVIIDENKIQIVIEFYSNQYTIPDNLGIQVETAYQNMVQVVVPIANLEQLANQDDVKFLRLPLQASTDQSIPKNIPEKITKDSKMDSVLTQIYNSNQQGAGIPSSINPNVIIDETKIQIVIEFHSNQHTIPDNLGIQVESTYENMVQVVMPIANLEQLANQDDVKFLRLPNFADNKPIIPDSEPEILKDVPSNLFFLIIIPIVIILIIWRIRRGKKIVEI